MKWPDEDEGPPPFLPFEPVNEEAGFFDDEEEEAPCLKP